MSNSLYPDPAERSGLMRHFYRDRRPTRAGRWVNRLQGWWSGRGLPPRLTAALAAIAERYPVYRIDPV